GIHGERIRTNILENRLREKDYTFDYEKQPSKALFKYRAAFDRNDADQTNFEYAKKLYASHGYQLPRLVFWNIASRSHQIPVKMNEQGVMLVSGTSPRFFQMIANKQFSPYMFMMEVLNSERYRDIAA
ncbi:MAG: DUF2828 family protein, partial [Oribacterium sp.]|nr:DUF2828 family protein [Oribacterium sp.]